MTVDDRVEAVTALLGETKAAHGVYEATELNGVYDQAWPAWYATYAVEHGIGDLLGQPVTADQLARLLGSSYEDFKRVEPAPPEGWAAYTAHRITSEL